MKTFRLLCLLALPMALAACSISVPAAALGPRGEVLTGLANASMSGGTFRLMNARLICSGTYDAMTSAPEISFGITCTDGNHGIAKVLRDKSMTAGQGVARMSNGEDWRVVFGAEAGVMTPALGR
jgi:hypothetical protein